MRMMRVVAVFAVLVLAVTAQMERLDDRWNLVEPMMSNSIESLGSGFAIVNPDLARVTLFSLLSPQQLQAGGAQGGQAQQNATQPAAGGQQNTTQPTTGGQQNATQGQQNATQGQAGGTSQFQQGFNLETQLASQLSSTSQQLQQWLLSNGAQNASITEINILRLSNQPVAVSTVVFECPINNLQNILQNVLNQGASGIDKIKFIASPQVLAQGTQTALTQAVSDAQSQSQLINSLVSGGAGGAGGANQTNQAVQPTQAGGQTGQTGQSGQILSVRVLDVKTVEEPAPEELARTFYMMVSEVLLNLQQGGIGSLFGGRQQSQQGGQQGQQMLTPILPIYINMIKTKVLLRQSLGGQSKQSQV